MMNEKYENAQIPTGLPGGFFIYEAEGDERILFAEMNIVKMFGCDTFDEFMPMGESRAFTRAKGLKWETV